MRRNLIALAVLAFVGALGLPAAAQEPGAEVPGLFYCLNGKLDRITVMVPVPAGATLKMPPPDICKGKGYPKSSKPQPKPAPSGSST